MPDSTFPPADILIIDDSESDTMLMEEAIKETMVTNKITIMHESREALKLLKKEAPYEDASRPDLIILDLKMPEFDGHDFLKVVKHDPELNFIPIIVLSTSSDPHDLAKSYRLMANCYIVKPVNFMKFKQVITVINDFWLGIARLPPKDMD